ncbi:hypothetical protein Tco_0766845 [Tanacetum coccineum]
MEDPRLFTLPCRLGDSKPFDTLADLGSCVNIILLYIFKNLNIELLEETDHIFGLADGTKSYPVGIVKDIEVHIGMAKIVVGEGITRLVFEVKVDLGEEEAYYWTTLGKRESYKPKPRSDGIAQERQRRRATNLEKTGSLEAPKHFQPFHHNPVDMKLMVLEFKKKFLESTVDYRQEGKVMARMSKNCRGHQGFLVANRLEFHYFWFVMDVLISVANVPCLPTEIYALVSQHRVAKDLWEKIKLLMQGTSLTKQERECKLYDEFDKFTYKKGETLHEYYLRFTLLLNDMNIYKMPLEPVSVQHQVFKHSS